MEELRDPPDSDDEETRPEEGYTPGKGSHVTSPTCGELNGSKHVTKHVQSGWYNHNNRSNSSLTSVGPLSPTDRASMSWNDVVKEGYGWGMSQHKQNRSNSFGYNTLHSALNRSNSGTSSRICLSFSDLSRIFPSAETVTRSSQHGLRHDQDNSSVSLPSLTDNFLSPMICYQKLEVGGEGGERVDLLNGNRALQRRSSTT